MDRDVTRTLARLTEADRPQADRLRGLAALALEGRDGWAAKADRYSAEGDQTKAAAAAVLAAGADDLAASYLAEIVTLAEAEGQDGGRR